MFFLGKGARKTEQKSQLQVGENTLQQCLLTKKKACQEEEDDIPSMDQLQVLQRNLHIDFLREEDASVQLPNLDSGCHESEESKTQKDET